ncbi:subtilisin-like protein [Lactarius quietus]|nr:subtilisin-like protein [Lactarius quietus]
MRCHHLSVLSLLSAALASAPSLPWNGTHIKHTWNTVPPNWDTLGYPPARTTINLHIALKPHRDNALIDALYAVSDPRSLQYGAHLSKEQVAQLVAPHPDTLELIHSWLEHHGVPRTSISTSQGGSGLTLTDVPVSQANELLGGSYQLYRPTGTNDTAILRTVGYALPAVLHDHVRTVVPTTYFASSRTLRKTPRRRSVGETADMASRAGSQSTVEPADLRSLYRTVYYVPAATDRNEVGVAGWENDYPSPADLMEFMIEYRKDAVDATYSVEEINGGGYNPKKATIEASLNMQYTQALAYPTKHIFYSTGGDVAIEPDTDEPAKGDMWFAWLNYMLAQETVPLTVSAPYGTMRKISRWNIHYLVRFVRPTRRLLGRDGNVQFVPEFPSSCPWVTSVGGTMGEHPGVAAELSGGGFSNHFLRPEYQDDVVPIFLEHLGASTRACTSAEYGRGIPDLAAQALGYLIVVNGAKNIVDGTSCATPLTADVQTVAGIISLLNDYRLSIGRKPLGFLNPWLYGLGRAGITDIKSGSNPGCGTEGFPAIVGWDPVTGLGSPDFLDLQDILYRMAHGLIGSASSPITSQLEPQTDVGPINTLSDTTHSQWTKIPSAVPTA